MPVFDFNCPSGHTFEEVFLAGDEVLDKLPCRCGDTATRREVNRFRIAGPVWSELDNLSQIYGREIRSGKDVQAWEKEHGLVRRSAYENKVAMEEEGHVSSRIVSRARSEGSDSAADLVKEINMCEALNWDEAKYKKHLEREDAATAAAAAVARAEGAA